MPNKKNGNSKIFFIIIPLIILIASFIYDNVIIIMSNKNYRLESENIIKDVLTNSYNDKEEMVTKFYKDKKLEIDQLDVNYKDEVLYVYNVHHFPAFFGKLFGTNSYRTEVNLKAYKDNFGKIVIEEVKED